MIKSRQDELSKEAGSPPKHLPESTEDSSQFGISTSPPMEIKDWKRSSLLSLEELTAAEIECILGQATKFKEEISNLIAKPTT